MPPGRGKRTARASCPDSNLARSSSILSGQAHCEQPSLEPGPFSASALTWTPTGDSDRGRWSACWAGLECVIYFGWLGTVVLLAVGSMKECMGGHHTNIDLGLLEGHPVPLVLGSMPPAGVKLSSLSGYLEVEQG